MLASVQQNAEEVAIHPLDEQWIKTLRFYTCFSKIADLDKYDYVTPFADTALIPRDHRAEVFLS